MNRLLWAARLGALCAAVALSSAIALSSCGGGNNPGSPTPAPAPAPTPTPTPTPPPSGGVSTTTITISAAGVTPRDIVVARGSQVTFVNTDGIGHDMNSDPHPIHTSCPDMNVGFVGNGQSGQTQVLNTARTCGYHDHNQPSNTNLQGTITIQ